MARTGTVSRGGSVIAAVSLVAAFSILLRIAPSDSTVLRWIDDLGQSAAAFTAAAAAILRSRRTGRSSRSWLLVGAATAAWGAGQLVFSWFDLISGAPPPVPSAADAGFLLFPVLALAALLIRPSAAFRGRGRARIMLDGVMVAAALFNVSWATTLGEVARVGADSPLAVITLLAYPIGDVVVLSVTTMVLIHARARTGLLMMCSGLAAMCVADSVFVYLVAKGTYSTGMWIDSLWFGAFILIALAAALHERADEATVPSTVSAVYLCLPYVLAAVGIGAAVISTALGRYDLATVVVASVTAGALLTRQLLTLIDNRALVQDVERQQGELRYRAFHDSLTGLANRSLFTDRVGHALDLHRRDGRAVAVLFCDLDDFKTVNDTLGHDAGDTMLRAVAERMRAVARTGDTVARLGGDEFAVLIEDDGDPTQLCRRVLDALAAPMVIDDRYIPARASIGVAALGADDSPVDGQELLKRADVAMYAAKQRGKSSFVVYSPTLRELHVDDLDLRLALTDDIGAGRVRAAFQPIVRADGSVAGYEALARWTHLGRPVAAERFVGLAERAGLITSLDTQVMTAALDALAATAVGTPPLCMAVNLGLSHLSDHTLPDRVACLLAQRDIDPRQLIIEVSERESIDAPEVVAGLRALRRLGVRIAIDDFGVGYSSLSRISALNPDQIKLDRSFVEVVAAPGASTDLLAAIIDLAHRVGAEVIAEGIETEYQRCVLRSLGCDALQGYLLGRPVEGPLGARLAIVA